MFKMGVGGFVLFFVAVFFPTTAPPVYKLQLRVMGGGKKGSAASFHSGVLRVRMQ